MAASAAGGKSAAGKGPLPPCPITGKPAIRRIHGMSARFVEDIWRVAVGVDVKRLFEGVDRFTLYESPTGLVFFEPRIVGDGAFYQAYYGKTHAYDRLGGFAEQRVDYRRAATYVAAGAKVLDIGCGPGVFRRHVAHARYSGLDPYVGPEVDTVVIRETLEAHAARSPEAYDVVAGFHVIEHTAEPLRYARLMAGLIKPGGLLILAAPLHPSPMTEVPNLPINIPPHHVTWWNPEAFRVLAGELGLEIVEACTLPPSPHQGLFHWAHRLLLGRSDRPPRERYVGHRWSWHAAAAIAYPLAKIAYRIKTLPAEARPIDAFLVARKPR